MYCNNCGNLLEEITYQARSADEAPRTIQLCKKCPLDSQRVVTALTAITTVARPITTKTHTTHNDTGPPVLGKREVTTCLIHNTEHTDITTTNIQTLVITDTLLDRLVGRYPPDVKDVILTTRIYMLTPDAVEQLTAMVFKDIVVGESVIESDIVAPMITLERRVRYLVPASVPKPLIRLCGRAENTTIPSINCTVIILTIRGKKRGIITLPEDIVAHEVVDLVHQITSDIGTARNISDITTPDMVLSLRHAMSKAVDVYTPPSMGYQYTSKPDGERAWIVRYGCLWLVVRPNRYCEIYAWFVHGSYGDPSPIGPLLDVEVIYTGDIILIDILMDRSGKLTPSTRDIRTVIGMALQMRHRIPFITLRSYFPTYDQALQYTSKQPYPTDGVMGIRNGTMSGIKVKTTRSIELRLTEDGTLVSNDDIIVAEYGAMPNIPVGSIVELRISAGQDGNVMVSDTALRHDKRHANNYDVCKSIIDMAASTDTLDPTIMQRITEWCFRVRKHLYDATSQLNSSRIVVLDIGSGRGQSLSIMNQQPSLKYILVEPNPHNIQILTRALGQANVVSTTTELVYAVSKMVTGNGKHVVFAGNVNELLEDKSTVAMIRNQVRAITSAFSVSYVADELATLASMNIPIIGCGYLYDGVEIGQCLIDSYGITMRRLGDTAAVVWPKADDLIEPIVTSTTFRSPIACFKAVTVVPYDASGFDSDIDVVCKHLSIISTWSAVRIS